MKLHARDASAAHFAAVTAAVVVGSLVLAGLQHILARRGMQATDNVDGLQGVGTAARYAALDVLFTLASLLIAARTLGVQHWLVAGLVVALGDVGLLFLQWRFLNAENQRGWAGAFVFAAALVVPALIVWVTASRWPTHGK